MLNPFKITFQKIVFKKNNKMAARSIILSIKLNLIFFIRSFSPNY